MPRGFRLEEHHIVHALQSHAVTCSDALLDMVFAALDVHAVERTALRGSDRTSQTAHACAEVWRQAQCLLQATAPLPTTPSPLLRAA